MHLYYKWKNILEQLQPWQKTARCQKKKGFIVKLNFITQFENIQIQSFKGVIYAWLHTTHTLNMLMTVFEEARNTRSGQPVLEVFK